MTSVYVNISQANVLVDNQQNINVVTPSNEDTISIVTIGSQGPKGVKGDKGSPGSSVQGGPMRLVISDTTLTSADYNIIADTTNGDIAIQLPKADSLYDIPTEVGLEFVVSKPIYANKISLLTAAGDTILGSTELDLDGQGAITFQAYGPGSLFIVV